MTRKRLLLWAGLPLLVVLLAAALVYGFRRDLAAWLIDGELAGLGLQGSRYTIAELEADGALFTNLTLPDGSVAAQRVVVSYDIGGLLRGRLSRVEIVGLRAAPSFVDSLLSDSGGGGLQLPALPDLVLTDAKVGIPTALGTVSTTFDLAADAGGTRLELQAYLPDAIEALPGYSAETSDLAFTAQGTLPPLAVLLGSSSEALIQSLHLSGTAALSLAGLSLPGQVERLDLALPLTWQFEGDHLVLASQDGGEVGTLKLPGFEPGSLSLRPGPLLDLRLLPEGYDLALTPDLSLELANGAEVHVATRATTRLGPDFAATTLALDPFTVEGAGWALADQAIETFALSGSLTGTRERLQGPVQVKLLMARTLVGDYPIEGLTVDAPFDAALTPASLGVTLREPTPVAVRQVYLDDAPLLTAGLQVTLEKAELLLDWADSLRLEHDVTLLLGAQSISLGTAAGALSLGGDLGRIELVGRTYDDLAYGGSLHLTAPRLEVPAYGAVLETVEATWVFPAPGEAAAPGSFSIGKGSMDAGMGTLNGITLAGEIVQDGNILAVTGKGRGPGGVGALDVAMKSDAATGKGSVAASWGPVTFKPKGLQPSGILSFFKDFKEVAGTVKATMTLGWAEDGGGSEVALTLTDLGFQHPQATVEGLSGKIVLDRLDQISARPAKLTVRRIDIGMPMTDIATTLRIKAGRTPTFVLTDTAFTLLGGRFLLPALDYSANAKEIKGTLTIQGLDLAALGQELAIEDLSLEGRMDGTLPIAFGPADETIVVTGGSLTATGPGVIRYGKAGTAEIRAGGDSNFALALQALEDFRFKVFKLAFDKEAGGKTELAITLEGANPAVLDGYPFRLNIALHTDLAQVLTALRDGYRLNPDLFKGGWTFQ